MRSFQRVQTSSSGSFFSFPGHLVAEWLPISAAHDPETGPYFAIL
jgi:hypothetical protein